jgi:hypothetical protein
VRLLAGVERDLRAREPFGLDRLQDAAAIGTGAHGAVEMWHAGEPRGNRRIVTPDPCLDKLATRSYRTNTFHAAVSDYRRPLHDEFAPVLLTASAGPAPSRACFDDEIAIDFPSVGAAVERMRDGLLGADDGATAHAAAVRLSRREASAGVTVALEVPLRLTCRDCGGRGESWTEPCAECHGSGASSRHQQFRLSVPPGVADGARFRFLIAAPSGVPTRLEVTVLVA